MKRALDISCIVLYSATLVMLPWTDANRWTLKLLLGVLLVDAILDTLTSMSHSKGNV